MEIQQFLIYLKQQAPYTVYPKSATGTCMIRRSMHTHTQRCTSTINKSQARHMDYSSQGICNKQILKPYSYINQNESLKLPSIEEIWIYDAT